MQEIKWIYEYNIMMAKRKYHLDIWEILDNQLRNTKDPVEKRKLYARRSNQRRLYRKYEAMANELYNRMRKNYVDF